MMTRRNRPLALAAAMLALGALAACDSPRIDDRAGAGGAEPPARVTFIGGRGSVVTIDLRADTLLAAWDITRSRTLEAVDEPRWDGQPIEDYAYDARRGIVFLLLPDRARESADIGKHYRIVAASLPDLERVASFALADSSAAHLLFDPVGDRLIAQAATSESIAGEARPGWRVTTVLLASPTLAERNRISQHVANVFDGSQRAPFIWGRMAEPTIGMSRVSPDGRWIVNGNDLVEIGADSLVAYRHDVSMSATDSLAIAASPGAVPGRFGLIVRDAGARRLLLMAILWPDSLVRPTRFLQLRDAGPRGAVHRLFEVPEGVATLLDDERHVLVQAVDGPLHRSSTAVNFTGRLFIYDGETGAQVMDFSDPRLAGGVSSLVAPICSAADLSRIFVRTSGGAIGVLRVRSRELMIPSPDALGHPSDLCLFGG
jgi:hypothetical protein